MKKKILVVEDDPNINKALSIRLSAAGYDVLRAEDGLIGLSTAVREHPDLMLLDISMPAGNGFTIVERMREHTDLADVPFMILTASKQANFRQTARDMGAYAYIEKPFDAQDILDLVESALAAGEPA